jgi:hypothetical protein
VTNYTVFGFSCRRGGKDVGRFRGRAKASAARAELPKRAH